MTHFINGHWVEGDGSPLESTNPATNEVIWNGRAASEIQVDAAVNAARQASPAWSGLSLDQRINVLREFGRQLEQSKTNLAEVIAQETGKPLWECNTEVAAMTGKIEISISAYGDRTGVRESEASGVRSVIRHKPHGVVAVYGPFNFPGHLPNGHIVPALLAGNTVVFKPSELTPLVAQQTLARWQASGLPPGVLNLVQGERNVGAALSKHTDIDGLFFTGSPGTGRTLHKQFAGQPSKILALELGGNNPLIVHGVSDLRAAAYNTIQSAYLSAGQRCTCARRLIVPRGADGDDFVECLRQMIPNIRIGPYTDKPEPFMGSVISNDAAEGLLKTQHNFATQGGTSLVEMRRVVADKPFLTPGLMDVTEVANRPDVEAFGPFLQLVRTHDFNTAIDQANDTAYGLSAGLFSDSAELFDRFYARARAGIVNWNRPLTGASSGAPFGGIGGSGNHRPSAYYAADYCAYPVAMLQAQRLSVPDNPTPGISL
ncbi:MAG: succinylglutamate-semialdehyde dehydrogenase [Gammaproteobacteria bacterium]|nr:succinylglutamate-semialdehyde dehydrogenase [Gammaproteobacteria bacterium]